MTSVLYGDTIQRMPERGVSKRLNINVKQRCSNCVYGGQIVAHAFGGNFSDDGTETRWVLNRMMPVGQTRNCFGFLQRAFSNPPIFIYPEQDDSCINPRKFRQK